MSAGSSESQSPELANRSVPPVWSDGLLTPLTAEAIRLTRLIREELELRRAYRFPPFSELIMATYAHRDEAKAQREAQAFVEHLSATIGLLKLGDIEVLGPSPAFLYRLKDEFRMEVTIRGLALHRIADRLPGGRGWSLDVDPM